MEEEEDSASSLNKPTSSVSYSQRKNEILKMPYTGKACPANEFVLSKKKNKKKTKKKTPQVL